jgi:DNA-binding response OmpR family regulator
MNELIAVVEDEEDIRSVVSAGLRKERFRVREYADGRGLRDGLRAETPSLVILDLMLPDVDGFALCRSLRADPQTASLPIIILTARDGEADRVLGLDLGADDYVVKPFSPKELGARVKAVLRRASPAAGRTRIEAGGGLLIDLDAMQVSRDGAPLELTRAEFRILEILASRPGRVYTRERILEHLWGEEKNVTDRSVDVHIMHLRAKLGPETGARIVNVRGVGYKMSVAETADR